MINKIYNNKDTINQIKLVLEKEGNIQLQNFLIDLPKIKVKLKEVYIPQLHKYRFNNFKINKEIKEFIEKIINKKLISSKVYEFKHTDYTLINDNIKEKEGYKIILDLTKNWNEEANGYTSFIKNNEEVFRINPAYNSLTIIKTNKNMKSFVKYVNNKAKDNKRFFIEINV
ncbi:MAG TPA: hypothetical protein VJI68_02155 [Candidatus Nanoarchaeia archaeon]|nr:hypothetical protein [Candidatus Nanoarchaeia archaeon]